MRKRFYFKSLLVAIGLLLGGVNSMLAQNVLFERAIDDWESTDADVWSITSGNTNSRASISATSGTGLVFTSVGENISNGYTPDTYTAQRALHPTASNSVLELTATWKVGSPNGKNDDTNHFLTFGDIEVRYYGQNQVWKIKVGSADQTAGVSLSRNSDLSVKITVNQTTKIVKYTIGSTTGTGTTNGDYDGDAVLKMGLAGKQSSWTCTSTLKALKVTEAIPAANEHYYTIKPKVGNSVFDIVLGSGTGTEDEQYTINSLPIVVKNGSNFYTLNDAEATNYSKTFTMGTSDEEVYVTYVLDETIVGFSEVGTGENPSYSGGGYTSTDAKLANATVNAGVYKAEIKIIQLQGGNSGRQAGVWVGDTQVATSSGSAGLKELFFTVSNNSTAVYVRGTGTGNYSDNLDYVIIRKLYDVTDASKIVGAVDYTTAQDAAMSADYTLSQGKVKVFTFKNHGHSDGFGKNWRILVKEGETYKAKLRADSYDDVSTAASNVTSYKVDKGSGLENLNWDEYATDMMDATVVATLTYDTDGTLKIRTTSTSATTGYIYYVDHDVTGLTSDLTINFSVENSWIEELSNAEYNSIGSIDDIAAVTYNGTEQTAVVSYSGTELTKGTNYTVTGTDALTNAGSTTFTITGIEAGGYSGSITKDFVINKATAVLTAPTAETLTYNGAAQALVAAGSTTFGEVKYCLTSDGEFSTTIPTGTNADTYNIYYKVDGTDNYNGVAVCETPVSVTIAQKEVGLSWSNLEFDADGTDKAPVATATGLIGEDACAVTVSGATAAVGTHTATATALSNANYKLPTTGLTQDFEIVRVLTGILFNGDSRKWATYCAAENLAKPADVEAYTIASVSGSTVTASDALAYIPENVPVLLYSTETLSNIKASAYTGATSTFEPASEFKGVTTAGTMTSGTNYILYNGQFVQAEGTSIAANRCYLHFEAATPAPVLSIVFADGTTGISVAKKAGESDNWYTLDGRKLDDTPAKKGLYIRNGRKVVIK